MCFEILSLSVWVSLPVACMSVPECPIYWPASHCSCIVDCHQQPAVSLKWTRTFLWLANGERVLRCTADCIDDATVPGQIGRRQDQGVCGYVMCDVKGIMVQCPVPVVLSVEHAPVRSLAGTPDEHWDLPSRDGWL